MKICIFIVYFINFYLISSFKLSKSIDKSDDLSISSAEFDKKMCDDINNYYLPMTKYISILIELNDFLLDKQREFNNFFSDKQKFMLNLFINKAGSIIFSNNTLITRLHTYLEDYCNKNSFKDINKSENKDKNKSENKSKNKSKFNTFIEKINRLFNTCPNLINTNK